MSEKLHAAYQSFLDADNAWQAALQHTFGKSSGDARYEPRGKGQEGTPLRAAYEAREAARIAWEGAK